MKLSSVKKVQTYDLHKKENGFLIELEKSGRFTTSYLTCTFPGAFKGYHLHRERTANYVCIKGKIRITLYSVTGKEEHVLSADNPKKLHIPVNVATGLLNEGNEEAWIINFPDPAYDPNLNFEQIDFTQQECDLGLIPALKERLKNKLDQWFDNSNNKKLSQEISCLESLLFNLLMERSWHNLKRQVSDNLSGIKNLFK